MEHVYIKSRTPRLNGKVERSHRTDKDESHQLLTYRDDVDLEKKRDYVNFAGGGVSRRPPVAMRDEVSPPLAAVCGWWM